MDGLEDLMLTKPKLKYNAALVGLTPQHATNEFRHLVQLVSIRIYTVIL